MPHISIKILLIGYFHYIVATGYNFRYTVCNTCHCIHSDGLPKDRVTASDICKKQQTYLLELYDIRTANLFNTFRVKYDIFKGTLYTNAFLNFEIDSSSGWTWINKQGTFEMSIFFSLYFIYILSYIRTIYTLV